ncbi:calcium-binding protein [Aurantiacibacter sp. D1-12]|uniref:calcium-binding protein n=1 Tax=Aurantiacibacter sp. D1-12 TaxID=2993658 RepID=UPI00237D1F2A|nr:calcium-binding protein [Aurantiacibacter sp. D1-12]MDE1468214.1 calcium-binding protein [Aurantiacibacter sp. D1-12]
MVVTRSGNDIVLSIAGIDGSFTLQNALIRATHEQLDSVRFADGTELTRWDIYAAAVASQATSGDDEILGSRADDFIDAGAGNDVIDGGDGNDTIDGRSGDDQISGGYGDDVLRGWGGSDTIWGLWQRYPNGANDDDLLYGENGNDLLKGGDGNDQLFGGSGNDNLRGEGGNDLLWGESGTDFLYGNDGDDQLIGGTGRDVMTGGLGSDVFIFSDGDFAGLGVNTADRIADFNLAENDIIDLSGVDAVAGGDDDQFAFIGGCIYGHCGRASV